MLEVRTVTAPDRKLLDVLVQKAVSQGWRPIGTPAPVLFNGKADRTKWQQAMRRK